MYTYISEALTLKNTIRYDKPNEDYYLCDDFHGVYIIADGVSRDIINGQYPRPSPSQIVSKIFVESAHEFYLKNISNYTYDSILLEMMTYGNRKIMEFNNQNSWTDDYLPGTVGIILVFTESSIKYSFIGDCSGFIVNNNNRYMFTKCQTQKIAKYRYLIDRKIIRNSICNNKNHPLSYGVLNGDVKALAFVEAGEKELEFDDKVLLATDGIYDAVETVVPKILGENNLHDLLRYSSSKDDKTLIRVRRNRN